MPEHRSVAGTVRGEKPRRFYVALNEQWSGLNPFQHFNWRDFTLVKIQGELASHSGRFELDLALLGFSCCITYVYDHSFNREMLALEDEIIREIEGRTGCRVVDPTGVLKSLQEESPPGSMRK